MSKTSNKNVVIEDESLVAKVSGAYVAAVDKASDAARGAAAGLEANPLAALLGGLALGAAAAALLPRSEREKALLAPLGSKLADAAREAIAAGRTAGTQALSDAGFDRDGLRDQVSSLFSQAREAASAAGIAAIDAAKKRQA